MPSSASMMISSAKSSRLYQPCLLLILLLGCCANKLHAAAIDAEKQEIAIALSTEPPDLNSMTSTDQVSFFILEHINEGLLGFDQNGALIPGVAESWEFDGKQARLYLRKNARWSDGKAVTAHDFIYAWQTLLKPETASRYAFILFPILNAQAINEGRLAPAELAAEAVNDYEVFIQLEKNTPWFPSLLAFPSYFPVREDFHRAQGDRYAADAINLLSNGPFTLESWTHGASLSLRKNPLYWNAQQTQLNAIHINHITQDSLARFNMFRDNEIALTELDAETLDNALQLRMQIESFQTGALAYLEFNHRSERPTSNHNLRRAIQAVFDPEEITYRVAGVPGNLPAYSIFPRWLQGVERPFWQEFPARKHKINDQLASTLANKAREELGGEIPPLTYLVTDQPGTVKQAEYFQNLMQRKLGIEIIIDKQTFKQRLAKMSAGDFDIVSAGWGPDYNDHSTFSDLFASHNENNHGKYLNPVYDELVAQSYSLTDTTQRMQLFAQMQTILQQDVALIPRMETGMTYVQHRQLKGVVRRVFGGDPSFRFAWISNNAELTH